jgi:hypothetical protein
MKNKGYHRIRKEFGSILVVVVVGGGVGRGRGRRRRRGGKKTSDHHLGCALYGSTMTMRIGAIIMKPNMPISYKQKCHQCLYFVSGTAACPKQFAGGLLLRTLVGFSLRASCFDFVSGTAVCPKQFAGGLLL